MTWEAKFSGREDELKQLLLRKLFFIVIALVIFFVVYYVASKALEIARIRKEIEKVRLAAQSQNAGENLLKIIYWKHSKIL